MVAQQALEAMPNEAALAAVVREALLEVPGITGAKSGFGCDLPRQQGQVAAVNPAAQQILNRSEGEILGCTAAQLFEGAIHEDGNAFAEEQRPPLVTLRTGQQQTGQALTIGSLGGGGVIWLSLKAQAPRSAGETLPHRYGDVRCG